MISGNHDLTLDVLALGAKVAEAVPAFKPELVKREFGDYGKARQLIGYTPGITYLDEGTHCFVLNNGACLTVYASPYTPSEAGNGSQYSPKTGHHFAIGEQVVVIIHGLPHGIMDMVQSKERAARISSLRLLGLAHVSIASDIFTRVGRKTCSMAEPS